MGKKRSFRKTRAVEVYDSDDERAYSREKVPDPTSSEYFNSEIDSFHADRDKIVLSTDKNVNLLPSVSYSDEEVLGFEDSDEGEDETLIAELRRKKQLLREQNVKYDLASDLEDSDDDDEIDHEKNSLQWGKNRRSFYGQDAHKKDIADYSDSEPNDYLLEEAEAKAIQRRQAELISENDFDIDFVQFTRAADSVSSEKEKIVKDLSSLSTSEKWQVIMEESPELLPLVQKYQRMLRCLDDELLPLMNYLDKCPSAAAAADVRHFLEEKICLWIDCCISISFYILLKVSHEPNMYDHPISKRIIEFQTLIKKLEAVERRFRSRLDGLVLEMKTQGTTSQSKSVRHKSSKRQTLNDDCSANVMSVSADMSSQAVENTSTNGNKVPVTAEKVSKRKSTGKHKLSQLISDSESDEAPSSAEMPEAADFTAAVPAKKKSLRDKDQISSEKAALTYYEMMRKSKNKNVPDEDVAEESNEDDDVVAENDDADEFGAMLNDYDEETAAETTDGRRAVTKQILRNRGLTPKRKKEYKNPRVKHRLKYRKAKIRRRGQIREVRHEINPYAGELSGIRAAVKRGVRLKA